jgi:hypothetical protein
LSTCWRGGAGRAAPGVGRAGRRPLSRCPIRRRAASRRPAGGVARLPAGRVDCLAPWSYAKLSPPAPVGTLRSRSDGSGRMMTHTATRTLRRTDLTCCARGARRHGPRGGADHRVRRVAGS